MPLPYRYLTSLILRLNGNNILIDCGEGTQMALRKKGWSSNPIGLILFTHYHADHISGLPGLLLTMGNAERTDPVLIAGPKGLERVVRALLVIAPELPFEIEFMEFTGDTEFRFQDYRIEAFRVNHNIICYGYTIHIDRAGKFNAERAKEIGIPIRYWSHLQRGERIRTEDGAEYLPEMVMGKERKGIKLTYTTDSRPTDSIAAHAADSDLFICEGMYGEMDKVSKAREYKHMTMYEAAQIAKSAGVKRLWLTHFSPSLLDPREFMGEVRKIFPLAEPGKDGKSIELHYEEE